MEHTKTTYKSTRNGVKLMETKIVQAGFAYMSDELMFGMTHAKIPGIATECSKFLRRFLKGDTAKVVVDGIIAETVTNRIFTGYPEDRELAFFELLKRIAIHLLNKHREQNEMTLMSMHDRGGRITQSKSELEAEISTIVHLKSTLEQSITMKNIIQWLKQIGKILPPTMVTKIYYEGDINIGFPGEKGEKAFPRFLDAYRFIEYIKYLFPNITVENIKLHLFSASNDIVERGYIALKYKKPTFFDELFEEAEQEEQEGHIHIEFTDKGRRIVTYVSPASKYRHSISLSPNIPLEEEPQQIPTSVSSSTQVPPVGTFQVVDDIIPDNAGAIVHTLTVSPPPMQVEEEKQPPRGRKRSSSHGSWGAICGALGICSSNSVVLDEVYDPNELDTVHTSKITLKTASTEATSPHQDKKRKGGGIYLSEMPRMTAGGARASGYSQGRNLNRLINSNNADKETIQPLANSPKIHPSK
jgi:hypothetical protein